MKRILLVFGAAVLAAGISAGCGKSDNTANTTPETDKATTAAQTAPAARGTSEAGTDGYAPPADTVEFSMSMRSLAYRYFDQVPDISEDKWKVELEKRTNSKIDIAIIPQNGYVEKMNLMFASGQIPDVVQASNYTDPALADAVAEGVFMPLDGLIEEYAPHLWNKIPKEIWDSLRYDDGHIYGLPEYLSSTTRRATYIRKDLLDKYNLEIPVTLDDYVEVMKAFKENGVKYPYIGREKFMYTDTFFGAFNALPTTFLLDENNQVVPAYIMPQMKEALKFHHMLYEEGLIDKESLLNKQEDWERKCVAGEVGIFQRNVVNFNQMQARLQQAVPDGEFIMIPGPVGEDGGHGVAKAMPYMRVFLFNKNLKNPERVLQFFDYMGTDEAAEFFSFGIEGEDYTKNSDGTIQYEYPTDTQAMDEIQYRAEWLWGVRDSAYNKYLLPFQPGGEKIVDYFENIAPEEGREWIDVGQMESLIKYPDLQVQENRQEYWQSYAAKVFYGEIDVDSTFDSFVEEYYKTGGKEVVEEATKRYNDGLAVIVK